MIRASALVAALAVLAFVPSAAARADDTVARTCVDVQIGSDRAYECLNEILGRSVPARRFSAQQDAPFSAASPAPAVGTYNQAATQQRLGSNFGKSAFPQRPPPAFFASPVLGAR